MKGNPVKHLWMVAFYHEVEWADQTLVIKAIASLREAMPTGHIMVRLDGYPLRGAFPVP